MECVKIDEDNLQHTNYEFFMASQPAWCLIHTKPKQELTAAEHLRRQNYSVYLPMLCKCEKRKGKQTNTTAPLFPRYLFILLSAGIDDWGPIRSTKGVSDFVRFGSNPAQVPNNLIDEIKAREEDNGFHYEMERQLQNGDKISITDGPFMGFNAIFKSHRGNDRAMILLDIIGKASRVEVAGDSIVKNN